MASSRSAAAGLLALSLLAGCRSGSVSGSISGAVGVTVEIAGPERVTSTTGRDGGFSFGDLPSGQYQLTPSLAGYSFTPPSRSVTVDGNSVAAQNFEAVGGSGALDVLFGSGGKVVLVPGDSTQETLSALTIQLDGRILATTNSLLAPDLIPAARVVRFLDDGSLDSTFGSGGIATLGVSGLECYGQAMAVVSDGRIVVAGGCHDPAGLGPIYLARLEADGGLDRSFGETGTVLLQLRQYGTASAVALAPDGRIVIAGAAFESVKSEVILARYLPEGRLDPTFGDAGLAASGLPGSVSALALQGDGKIVVAGAQGSRTLVARFEASGSLDLGFADGGVATPPPSPTPFNLSPPGFADVDAAYALVVGPPDGKIITVGLGAELNWTWLTFTRWTSNGALDPLVGTVGPGIVSLPFFLSSVANTVGLDSFGNLVIGGYGASSADGAMLFRCHDDGTLDRAFATDGVVAEQPPGTSDVRAVVRQPDGEDPCRWFGRPDARPAAGLALKLDVQEIGARHR